MRHLDSLSPPPPLILLLQILTTKITTVSPGIIPKINPGISIGTSPPTVASTETDKDLVPGLTDPPLAHDAAATTAVQTGQVQHQSVSTLAALTVSRDVPGLIGMDILDSKDQGRSIFQLDISERRLTVDGFKVQLLGPRKSHLSLPDRLISISPKLCG